jgi:MFS family permease
MGGSLLKSNRNYRLLLSGSVATNLSDGVAAVAMPWLATLLTRDPLMIAAVSAAGTLPWLLFALPCGVWTDRADRRRLMLGADGVRLILTLGLVAMTFSMPTLPNSGSIPIGAISLLAAMAFLLCTAEVVRDNAAQTILPALVPPDELERANGQMWSAEQVVGRFVGPPLAGALIAAGIVVPFGFQAAMLALGAGIIWLIIPPVRKAAVQARFWPALLEGVTWMRRSPAILRLAVMLGLFNAVAVGGWTILVLYAQEVLGLEARGYGWLIAAAAAGAVLGGLVAPEIARQIGMRASLILALATFVLLHLALGLFGSVVLAGLAMFVEAAGVMLWNVVTVSYRQRLIPDALLGRVNAVYRFFAWGSMPLGSFAAGALVSALEPVTGRAAALHSPYLLGALICGGLLAYGVGRLRFER